MKRKKVNSLVSIGDKKIGKDAPTYVIAEMAWSHDGELEKAKKIVKGAGDAKADAICFHITSMENYMVKDYRVPGSGASAAVGQKPLYEFLNEKNLSESDWAELFSQAKAEGLHILVMANDAPSFEFSEKLHADGYIVAPATIDELSLLEKLAKSGKSLFIRAGGATPEEVERAIKIAKDAGNTNLSIIHGFQSFPTPLEEMNLCMMGSFKDRFGISVGFTDHTDGGSEMALIIPLVAVGAGADLIEKHITHDRSLKGVDFESALDPKDFEKMVKGIREVGKSLGSASWKDLSEKELRYRKVARKNAVAKRDIKSGEAITLDDITFKRANGGLYADQLTVILGKKAKKDLNKDDELYEDMFE